MAARRTALAAAARSFSRRKYVWIFPVRVKTAALAVFTVISAAAGCFLWFSPVPPPVPEFAEKTALFAEFTFDKDRAFETLDGGKASIAAQRGRPVFLYVWAGWSPYCSAGMDIFAVFDAEHPDITCLYLNAGENPKEARGFLTRRGLFIAPSRVLLDTDGGATLDFMETEGIPAVFVYDARGRFFRKYKGVLSARELEAAYIVACRA